MKTLNFLALFLGLTLAGALPATVPSVKDCLHFVLKVKTIEAPKPLFKMADTTSTDDGGASSPDVVGTTWQENLTQADFIALSVLASLASNTMISKNNSAFRAVICSLAALHGSALATELWGKDANRFCALATGATAGALSGAASASGWKVPQIKLDPIKVNKFLAILVYLLGQNAPQVFDLLKEYWKGGLLNPMPFVRVFTKNRDRSELAAIAVRNLLPLALFTKQGAGAYKWAKTKIKPQSVSV